MDYTGKIRVYKAEQRELIAGILSANGYKVWQGKEMVKRSPQYFVYFKDMKEVSEGEGKVHSPGRPDREAEA